MVLHLIRIACLMVLRDIGGGGFGASPYFDCFRVGSLVSLATIEKSENTNRGWKWSRRQKELKFNQA